MIAHLHLFDLHGVEYGQPEIDDGGDFDWKNERGVNIAKLLGVGESFGYCYDFGDNWNLTIEVEKSWPVRFVLNQRHSLTALALTSFTASASFLRKNKIERPEFCRAFGPGSTRVRGSPRSGARRN